MHALTPWPHDASLPPLGLPARVPSAGLSAVPLDFASKRLGATQVHTSAALPVTTAEPSTTHDQFRRDAARLGATAAACCQASSGLQFAMCTSGHVHLFDWSVGRRCDHVDRGPCARDGG